MQKQRLWRKANFILLTVAVAISGTGTVFAVTSNSSNYQVVETEFGAGGTLESCSNQYCARASIGDLAGGSSTNNVSTAAFGSVTPDEPMLEVIVDAGESDLGVLTTERTATKTTIVRIRNYLSSGYVLQITGSPPKYQNHTLKTSATPVNSSPGTEQFGINAVANTTPSVGSNPLQVPSSSMSFGFVEAGYNIPNQFKYTSEDVVARSNSASGRTDYTVSLIVNVSNTTPAGHFAGDFAAVVIPVY